MTVLTIGEVATLLRVHQSTIYRMLRRRQLPAFKVGRDWRFMMKEIEDWTKQQELKSSQARGLVDKDAP